MARTPESSSREQSDGVAAQGLAGHDIPSRTSTPPNPKFCDARLEDLDTGFWTSVDIPSELAGRMISLYLETDHPLLGTFDADAFVSDLVQKRDRFCSRLLFSAVLYWSCVRLPASPAMSSAEERPLAVHVYRRRSRCERIHAAV